MSSLEIVVMSCCGIAVLIAVVALVAMAWRSGRGSARIRLGALAGIFFILACITGFVYTNESGKGLARGVHAGAGIAAHNETSVARLIPPGPATRSPRAYPETERSLEVVVAPPRKPGPPGKRSVRSTDAGERSDLDFVHRENARPQSTVYAKSPAAAERAATGATANKRSALPSDDNPRGDTATPDHPPVDENPRGDRTQHHPSPEPNGRE